jgi:hypothetical protein
MRKILRDELRLNLADEASGRTAAPIRLRPGLPEVLQGRSLADDMWLAALLAPFRRSLEHLRDGADGTSAAVAEILRRPDGHAVVGDLPRSLRASRELAELLLRETQKVNLVEWILEVNEDVLGAYWYGHRGYGRGDVNGIALYWAVIGLFAQVLHVATLDLAGVVLAHELAHSYTHLGADIDGYRWQDDAFGASEHPLIEGLAQYYTERVCRRLQAQYPGCLHAYETLLRHQPPAYRTHLGWTESYKPEEVRLAMIQVRRQDKGRLVDFEGSLSGARSELRRGQAVGKAGIQESLFDEDSEE